MRLLMIFDHTKHEDAKKAAGKERKDTTITKICLRKAADLIGKTGVISTAAEASGCTSSDIMRWINAELPEVKFKVDDENSCCFWAWCCNLVIPDKTSQTWQAIVCGPNYCLYALDFKLTEAGVEIVGEPMEVTTKDHYVMVDKMVEEADDEAHGRSTASKSERKLKPGLKYRIMEVTPEEADEKDYSIPVSFASETPGVQHCDPFGMGRSECERAAGIQSGDSYIEILSHDAGDVDYSVLNNEGAVLDEHDEKDQIGVVKKGSAHLDRGARVSRCVLRMDDSTEKGRMRFRQMQNGIRTHLSAGYAHTKFLKKEKLPDGQTAYYFATKGLEVSSVAVPMDGGIGVGRCYRSITDLPRVDLENKARSSETQIVTKENSMTDAEIKAAADAAEAKRIADVAKERAETETRVRAEEAAKTTAAVTSATGLSETNERNRCKEILTIADTIVESRPDLSKQARKLATECIEKNVSQADFKIRVNTELFKAVPATQNTMETLGLKGEEYDLCKAIQNIIIRSDGGRKQGITAPDPDTVEGQADLRIRKLMKDANGGSHPDRENGFLVPADANISSRKLSRNARARMTRDATMQATLFNQGGATVQTEILLPIIEILRNEMVTTELGVTSLSGLEGNIAIPRQAAASTAYALPETGALLLSGQILDQVVLTPHKVGAFNAYSRQLLLQSTIDLENFMRTDMFAVIALAWDYFIINGQGAGDQPTGILNTNGVTLVNGNGSFTGYSGDNNAPSWSDIVNFETQIAKLNARRQGRAWATTSNAKGRLKTLARLLVGATTVPSVPLWEDGMEGKGMMNGYSAVDSQQIPNDQLMFGVWMNNVIHGLWGGLSVIVDPYTAAAQSVVKIYMDTFGDVAIRHPQEFCMSLTPASA